MYRSNSNQMQHVDSHHIKFCRISQDFIRCYSDEEEEGGGSLVVS